jgi:hypothetical protein
MPGDSGLDRRYGLARYEFPNLRVRGSQKLFKPSVGSCFGINRTDGRDKPDKRAIGAMHENGIPQQIPFGPILLSQDSSAFVKPVIDQLALVSFLN